MAARFAVATGNWNDNNTWAASSGGAPGASFPTVADSATLDAASGNVTVTVNVSSAALSLTCTGFTGTLVFNAQLSVSGSITLASGMTLSGTTGPLVPNATGTLTSAGKTIPCPLTFGTSATYTLADNWTVTGLVTAGVTTGTTTLNGNQITCNGGYHQAGTVAIVQGTTKLVLAGGTWDSSTTTRTNNPIDFAGNVTVSGTVTIGSNVLTYVSGTVTTTGSTLANSGTLNPTLNTAGIVWNNITLLGPTTVTLSSTLAWSGTLTPGTSTSTVTFQGAGALSGTGAVSITSAANLVLNNTGGLTTTGTWTWPNGNATIGGTSGFTVGTLTTATLTASRTHTLTFGNTYTVTTVLSSGATAAARQALVSSSPGSRVIFTVSSGASLSLAYCDPTDIDSSAGALVLSVGASISNSLNWVGTLTAAGSYSGGGRIIGA